MIALDAETRKAPGSRDRCVPVEETALHIPKLRELFGITRVGDTSLLDRTGIPTYCAMVPNSPDILGVYNGKGPTHLAARVSAVMEAFERQAAANFAPIDVLALSVDRLEQTLDLGRLGIRPEARRDDIECVMGTNLYTALQVPVPLALVKFPWRGANLFSRSTTNGLASGNNLSEALYHALVEMIERHVWSLFYVRSQLVPQFYRGASATQRAIAPELAFPCGDTYLDAVHQAITGVGLKVRVMILLENDLPPVALASVVESGSSPPMAHVGFGCSLSTSHAVERALTEAIQSRVVDVQAAREDIIRPNRAPKGASTHAMRPSVMPEGYWFIDLPAERVELSALPDEATESVARDLEAVLQKLIGNRISDVVAVDISPAGVPLSVVRIVAPDFETAAIDGRIGPIALDEFNPLKSRSITT